MIQHSHYFVAITLATGLALAISAAAPTPEAKRADSYAPSQVTISGIEDVTPSIARIEFNTLAESAWYCPGVDTFESADAVYLEFVRAGYRARPSSAPGAKLAVSQMPRTFGKDRQREIVVHHKGKPIFVRAGKSEVRIYPLKKGNKGR